MFYFFLSLCLLAHCVCFCFNCLALRFTASHLLLFLVVSFLWSLLFLLFSFSLISIHPQCFVHIRLRFIGMFSFYCFCTQLFLSVPCFTFAFCVIVLFIYLFIFYFPLLFCLFPLLCFYRCIISTVLVCFVSFLSPIYLLGLPLRVFYFFRLLRFCIALCLLLCFLFYCFVLLFLRCVLLFCFCFF